MLMICVGHFFTLTYSLSVCCSYHLFIDLLTLTYFSPRWEDKQLRDREVQKAEKEKEKALLRSIDWHTFVVVETIQFTAEDDKHALQAPIDFSKQQIATALDPEEQAVLAEAKAAAEAAAAEAEMEDMIGE